MRHVCKRCGYSSVNKGDLKKHLEKKKECTCVNGDISREELIKDLYPVKNTKFKCPCGKNYAYHSGLSLHKKSCTFESEDNVGLLALVKELEEKIKRLETNAPIPNVINNITTNNTTNLIINDFGKENIDYITEAFIRTCLKQQDHGFVKLTEKIHFNDKHPENQTVKLPNKKEPYVQVIEKGKQTLKPKKEVIDDLIINIGNILDEQLEYVVDELKKKLGEERAHGARARQIHETSFRG